MMAILDHWHPVCRISDLGQKPTAVQIDGQAIALFRVDKGQIGAVDDTCIHRRMKLSLGKVAGGKLQCPYHGWAYDVCGHGESPGSPKMEGRTVSYETREAHGVVWIRNRGTQTAFPHLDVDGWYPFLQQSFTAPAPVELTLDNFTEVEHVPFVHDVFGHDLAHLKDVTVKTEPTEQAVRVINVGPHQQVPWWMRIWLGISKRYYFHNDWTTYFSPLYTVFDHWWSNQDTHRESMVRYRVAIFYVPASDHQTTVWVLGYARTRWFLPMLWLRLFRPIMAMETAKEISKDMVVLKGLASYNPSLEGMKLGRFDRALGLHRERIQRIYRNAVS
jgi:phenylpropionate dioxygenase-like ring-hydroxylating dioxygenase large terminal subunit